MVPSSAAQPQAQAGMRVFLSHSTRDAEFVHRLADGLTGAGFTPWLCEVDIGIGENFVRRIKDGLAQCDVALLVWSPDAANSAWVEEEWVSQKKRQVEEHKVRLAVILFRDHPLPPLLTASNYIDARYDQPGALRRTVEWLQQRHAVQRLSGLRAPVYLPDYPLQEFVGRSAYLEKLRTTLSPDSRVGTFLLYGQPGAGKSTLALRFAWEAQKDFDAVIFQLCGQRPLDAITAELADRLPIDVKLRPPEEQRAAAKQWLRQRQSLLILDDVWTEHTPPAELKQLEPGPPCCVLYTSRRQSLPWIPPAETIQVEKFTEEEAQELFHTYLDATFGESEVNRQREALLNFARQVELLPIAVSVAANMLRQKQASGLRRAVLKIRLDELTDRVRDVNALFRKAIEIRPEPEQKLLTGGAICVPEGFWLPLAAEIAGLSEDESEDAADELVHSSLLRITLIPDDGGERRRFNLHALMRDQLRARVIAADLANLQERHANALEKLFEDRQTRWRDCRECLEEIIPAVDFLSKSDRDARAGQLSYRGYDIAEVIGELDAAFRIVKHWEALCEAVGDLYGLQASYGNQALILQAWGRLEEALALHEKEEAIALELGNKDQLQRSYGNQALILKAWGRLEEALALHKKEEAIATELGNRDQLQRSYGNQAAILQTWGRLEEALALHKKEEAIATELGDQDGLQASYGNQALILIRQGKLEEALILLRRSEAICIELGLKRDLGYCYGQWAWLARAQGDRKTAKEKLQQALAIFTELKMPRERDAAQAALDKLGGEGAAASS